MIQPRILENRVNGQNLPKTSTINDGQWGNHNQNGQPFQVERFVNYSDLQRRIPFVTLLWALRTETVRDGTLDVP